MFNVRGNAEEWGNNDTIKSDNFKVVTRRRINTLQSLACAQISPPLVLKLIGLLNNLVTNLSQKIPFAYYKTDTFHH